ncbi:MAG: hypothetical protein ABI210_12540, partial [Abditibacteriaceae bacterium]
TLELGGDFDGKTQTVNKEFLISAQWSRVTLDFTPPLVLSGDMRATITIPEGAKILLDDVSFQPLWSQKP